MDNDPVVNMETHLKAYWSLTGDLDDNKIEWIRYEIGTQSITRPTIFIELGDHWYTETAGRLPRSTCFQEIYITPMHHTGGGIKDAIETRHEELWDLREEIESIIKTYRTQVTGIAFINLIAGEMRSWRVNRQWKLYEVDVIARWEL